MMKKPTTKKAPFGWFLAGSHPSEYQAKLDSKVFHSGTRSCRVDFIGKKKPSGWTTLMQNMRPKNFLGKRLRMKFWARTKKVKWISGWMRVDDQSGGTLSFENMCNRKLEGTNDWIEQEIVLDVPEDTSNIGFGVIFHGQGTMWIDRVSFEVVTKRVKLTSCPCSRVSYYGPVNLDFESDDKKKTKK